jgi:MFS family permease
MNNRAQLTLLFLANFIVLFVGMGLYPVLPLYAAGLGASAAQIGAYFALMYVANGLAPVVVAGLAARVPRRVLFIGAAAAGVPALALLSRATTLWQAAALTSLLWFSGGVAVAVINVLNGLASDRRRRGAAFSLISLTAPLGAVLGGWTVAWLLGRQGYELVFGALTALWVALPVLGLALRDAPAARGARAAASGPAGRGGFAPGFYQLLGAVLLAGIGLGAAQLGRSLSMQAAGFTASAIAQAAALGGLAALPMALAIGTLADRLGRGRLLLLSYLAIGAAAVVLAGAAQPWHFWLAAILTQTGFAASRGLNSAVAADVLPAARLGAGLPLVNAVGAGASIVSYLGAGLIFGRLGPAALYAGAAALAIGAALAVRGLDAARTQAAAAVQPECPAVL